MKLSYIALVVLACAACTTTTTTESVDSTAFAADTLPATESYAEEDSNPQAKDTTYTLILEIEAEFENPQLDRRIAYVYSRDGLIVYVDEGGAVAGQVDYGDKITLVEPLVNNKPGDIDMMAGLRGHSVEIVYEGKPGWVFSGYLSNFPVPEGNNSASGYFTKFLKLMSPATREVHDCDCDSQSSTEKWEFENGITVKYDMGYESYNNEVTFPEWMTLQELYLFSGYFYNWIGKGVTEFPGAAFKEQKDDYFSIEVKEENGQITSIVVTSGEGCFEEEGIYRGDKGVYMSAGGGC